MSAHNTDQLPAIIGSGKGGGGGEDPNTLFSKARMRIVDILSEGEIEAALVDGAKSIYFDYTPLMNDQGQLNFEGVIYETRSGLPDQAHLVSGETLETPYPVSTRVYKNRGPVIRTIHDENADAAKVIINIPSLSRVDDDEGTMEATSVRYQIHVRAQNGSYSLAVDKTVSGKTTSPYQLEHIIELPTGGYPWDIKVTRITDDSNKGSLQNETYWESYIVMVRGKFIFPNTAVIGLQVDAEKFGSNLPNRTYHVRGIKIAVPSNYDPMTREYSGIWNGTFQTVYSNNPAWVLYDLIINDRYGLGQFVDASKIDKWSLYRVAQYCDELVPSGLKDSSGVDVMEPRFTFNGVINTRTEAFRVLRDVSAMFRGMVYWSLGQVFAVADMPEDPVKLVTPANVLGGKFKYSGTALKARHSVALVTFNDPDDFYRPAIEAVIDDELLAQFGWRETEVPLMGCTSRGQALRFGRWILDTAKNETETVEYEASWDHANVRPGDIVSIADPRKAELRSGGRIVSVDGTSVTLDGEFTPDIGQSYNFSIVLPDGAIATVPIASFPSPTRITLANAITESIEPNAVWLITGGNIPPRYYRVLAMSESEKHTFRITALSHDPTKYARVEEGFSVDPPAITPPNYVGSPRNLSVQEINYTEDGLVKTKLYVNWSPPDHSSMVTGYRVTATTPNGTADYGLTPDTWLEILNVSDGPYIIYVKSVSSAGYVSGSASYTILVESWSTTTPPEVTTATVTSANTLLSTDYYQFETNDITIGWTNVLGGTGDSFYKDNVVQIFDYNNNNLLRTEVVVGTSYTYTLANNLADSAKFGNFSTRYLNFVITVRDTLNRQSDPYWIYADNYPPAYTYPNTSATVYPGYTTISVYPSFASWTPDTVGMKVWVVPQGVGVDFTTTAPTFDGAASTFTYNTVSSGNYTAWIVLYDSYGYDPAEYYAQQRNFTAQYGAGGDTNPPGPITNFDTTTATSSTVTLIWTVPTDADYASCQIWRNTSDTLTGATNAGNFTGSTGTVSGLSPNTLYYFWARAVDTSGNYSAYTVDSVAKLTSIESGSTTAIIDLTTSTTLLSTHANKYLRMNSATAVTITIPSFTTTEWPIGAEFHVCQAGAGQVTISSSTYTLNVPATYTPKTRAQYGVITAKRVSSTAWDVFGLLADATV